MKLDTLYGDINPNLLPEDLRRFHDAIPASNEQGRHGIRMTYLTPLLEARTEEALFWLVPDGDDWRAFSFERSHFKQDSHVLLWRDHLAQIVAEAHGKEVTDDFKKLYAAYPRGRLVEMGQGKWAVGFGEDYPPGWDAARLLRALRVGEANASVVFGAHWRVEEKQRIQADLFLGRR